MTSVTSGRSFQLTAAEHRDVDQIDRLVALGTSGVDELLASMSNPSWTVRRASIAALAALGDDAVAPLCRWLCDRRTEEHAIAAAIDALVASVGASTNIAVLALLADPRPVIAADAAQILGRRRASEAGSALAHAMSHVDDNVALAAIEAIGAIGGSTAVDQLIAIVHQGSFFRAFPALHVLAKSGDPRAVGLLASLVEHEVYGLDAVRALGRTGSLLAVAPLAALLPLGGVSRVRLVARAFEDLVTRAELDGCTGAVDAALHALVAPSLAHFVAALPAEDPAERVALAIVLGRVGDASAIPALATLIDDFAVRRIAVDAVRRIGSRDEAALLSALAVNAAARVAILPGVSGRRAAPIVRALLGDDDAEVRACACHALARIGDVASVPELFATLGDGNPKVVLAATAAIQSLGVADTSARALTALACGSPTVRRAALRIIGNMGFADAFEAVCAAVEDLDPQIANLAVTCLGAIDNPRADRMIERISRGPDQALRVSAIRAAVHRLGMGASGIVERGLVDDFAWVRYHACRGAVQLGAPAVDKLVARLADPAPFVRIAAIEGLAQLETPAAWASLCAVARSPDADEQRAALTGIGLRSNPEALPLLLDAARSSDLATRLIALSGLARRPEDAALEVVAAAVLDFDEEVRDAALSLLGERVDRAAAEAVVDLALTCAPGHPVQLTLSWPDAARIAAIAARFAIVDDRRALLLAAALARMGDAAATTTLFDTLAVANPPARRAAAKMVVAMGVQGARAAVGRLANEDPDLEVRRVCAALVAG